MVGNTVIDIEYERPSARKRQVFGQLVPWNETLNFDIEVVPNDARIVIAWTDVQISFTVQTSTDQEIEAFIREELLSRKSNDTNLYAGAAEYYLYQGENHLTALELAEYAIELDPGNGWARNLKINLYEQLKRYNQALAEIERAEQAIRASEYEDAREKANSLRQLADDRSRIEKQKD